MVALAEEEVPRIGLALIAGLIAICTAVERIGKFGERWLLYRLAYESLNREANLFAGHAGAYSSGDANALLVERVESILRAEGADWGSITQQVVSSAPESRLPLP